MARKWLDANLGTGVRATVDDISNKIEDLGLPAVKKSANVRTALKYKWCLIPKLLPTFQHREEPGYKLSREFVLQQFCIHCDTSFSMVQTCIFYVVKSMYSDLNYNKVAAFYKPSNPKTFPVIVIALLTAWGFERLHSATINLPPDWLKVTWQH